MYSLCEFQTRFDIVARLWRILLQVVATFDEDIDDFEDYIRGYKKDTNSTKT